MDNCPWRWITDAKDSIITIPVFMRLSLFHYIYHFRVIATWYLNVFIHNLHFRSNIKGTKLFQDIWQMCSAFLKYYLIVRSFSSNLTRCSSVVFLLLFSTTVSHSSQSQRWCKICAPFTPTCFYILVLTVNCINLWNIRKHTVSYDNLYSYRVVCECEDQCSICRQTYWLYSMINTV